MASVTPIRSPCEPVFDASDIIAHLIDGIPGWRSYRHSPESQIELRRAAQLLEEAIPLLRRVSEREHEMPGGQPDED
jgi:hypothetical protein